MDVQFITMLRILIIFYTVSKQVQQQKVVFYITNYNVLNYNFIYATQRGYKNMVILQLNNLTISLTKKFLHTLFNFYSHIVTSEINV